MALGQRLAEVRSRKAPALIAPGRPADAARDVQAAADLREPLVASDPRNVQQRADLACAWLRLGDAGVPRGTPMRPSSEAAALFSETRDVGGRTLALPPGYTQVRKQMAMAEIGLEAGDIGRKGARWRVGP